MQLTDDDQTEIEAEGDSHWEPDERAVSDPDYRLNTWEHTCLGEDSCHFENHNSHQIASFLCNADPRNDLRHSYYKIIHIIRHLPFFYEIYFYVNGVKIVSVQDF